MECVVCPWLPQLCKTPSLVIISPSDIFNRQSDRQCKQAWPCREAINFGNSSEQFVLGAGWLRIQCDSPRRIHLLWYNGIYYMAGPQIPYLCMEFGLVYETKEVRGHMTHKYYVT